MPSVKNLAVKFGLATDLMAILEKKQADLTPPNPSQKVSGATPVDFFNRAKIPSYSPCSVAGGHISSLTLIVGILTANFGSCEDQKMGLM